MELELTGGTGRGLAETVEALGPWFHNLHLPGGVETAPDHFLGDFPSYKWQAIAPHLPDRLDGWSVLDIGCNAGFYSFELARRGAAVTGVDADPRYLRQARWAASVFQLEDRVRFERMQVYDLARSEAKYDLVLFLGVFYHLRYPLLGLDIVAARVGRLMVFQTMTMPGGEVFEDTDGWDLHEREAALHPGWPKMAFIEHALGGDPTNWWLASHSAVLALLRSSGLRILGQPAEEIYLCEPDPDNPSSVATWNQDELLAATGRSSCGAAGRLDTGDPSATLG